MFCGKCGARNDDNVAFCCQCGAKLNDNSSQMGSVDAVNPMSQNDRNRKIGIAAVAAAAVVVVLLLISLLGGRSYKKTIDQLINGIFECDAEAIVKLMPDAVIKNVVQLEDMTREEMIEELDEGVRDQIEDIREELGSDWSYSYEIVGDEKIVGDDLLSLKQVYGGLGVDMEKITEVRKADVELTIKADGVREHKNVDICVIKIGNSWYLDFYNTMLDF